jgi:Tfp pilus assembly protein PilO
MNTRERILAILVGAVIVGYIGFSGIRTLVIEPHRQLLKDISEAREELSSLRAQQERLPKRIDEWETWTARALAMDAEEAQSVLRENLNGLMLEAGMTNPRFSRPRAQKHLLYNNRGPFEEVLVPVTVTGKYPQLVSFLKAFYEQPYLSSLRKVNVKVQRTASRSARSKKSTAVTEPSLEINLTAAAMVLPEVPSTAAREYDPNIEAAPRLVSADPKVYDQLRQTNVFMKWQPPVKKPPVKETPVKKPPVVEKPPVKETPPPPPPPAPERTLVGVENFGGRYFAYVRDDVDLTLPLLQISIGDEFDDGELLFVDRDGVVVRGPEERTHKPDEVAQIDWFYPLGETYDNRTELTRGAYPRVYSEFHSKQAAVSEPEVVAPAEETVEGPEAPSAAS